MEKKKAGTVKHQPIAKHSKRKYTKVSHAQELELILGWYQDIIWNRCRDNNQTKYHTDVLNFARAVLERHKNHTQRRSALYTPSRALKEVLDEMRVIYTNCSDQRSFRRRYNEAKRIVNNIRGITREKLRGESK